LGAATTIVNAKVFDGTTSQDWTSVRFAYGLITECSVASAAQEGDEVIDAGGGTVLPGLIDAHVHLVPGGTDRGGLGLSKDHLRHRGSMALAGP